MNSVSNSHAEDFSIYNGEGTELRKAQMCMLEILIEIDKVCKRHGITYWLDYGTLLGAVRHGGFIPWDDDADLCVFKKDSSILEKYLIAELPDRYYVFSEKTDRSYGQTGYFRVVDRKTQMLRSSQSENDKDELGNSVAVDIFNIEKGKKEFKELMNRIHGRARRRIRRDIEDGAAKRILAYLIYPFTTILISLYRAVHVLSNTDCYVYNIPNFVTRPMFIQRHRNLIDGGGCIEFEGHLFSAPGKVHEYLKETYGDYMTIPPKDRRETHSVFIKVLE